MCMQAGKDRTGLVSMLVLACAGAPDDVIVADYAHSDGYGVLAMGGMEKVGMLLAAGCAVLCVAAALPSGASMCEARVLCPDIGWQVICSSSLQYL